MAVTARETKRQLADEALKVQQLDITEALPGSVELPDYGEPVAGTPEICPRCRARMTLDSGWTISSGAVGRLMCGHCGGVVYVTPAALNRLAADLRALFAARAALVARLPKKTKRVRGAG